MSPRHAPGLGRALRSGALALAAACLLFVGVTVSPARATVPLPESAQAHAPGLRALGDGQLRWLGLRIYDAQLWVSGEHFSPDQPHALALRYHRAIASERLVETSIDEMRRLGNHDAAQLEAWREMLARAFPSVDAGQSIVGVHLPGTGAVFWHEGEKTAEVNDPALARYFFGIWLDAHTRMPNLRKRLLGEVTQ